MDYAKLIKRIRETLFLTQTQFGEIIGVSFETVNRWENGKFNPSMKIKKKIHDICKENNIEIKRDDE